MVAEIVKTPVIDASYGVDKKLCNHIVVQIDSSMYDSTYLRIAECETVAEYKRECAAVYPEWRAEDITVFFNAARWYDRLLSDIGYKKFMGFKLDIVKPGLWVMTTTAEGFVNSEELIKYIDRKINAYYEDEADDTTMIDKLNQLVEIDFDIFDYIKLDNNLPAEITADWRPSPRITIPNMETNRDGEYIPTYRELLSFALYAFQNVMYDLTGKNELQEISFEVCNVTGNIILPKNAFTYPETRYIISKLLKWDCKEPFDKFFADIIQRNFYQKSLVKLSGITHNVCSTKVDYADYVEGANDKIYDPYADNFVNVQDMTNMVYNSDAINKVKFDLSKLKEYSKIGADTDFKEDFWNQQRSQGGTQIKQPMLLYKNVISKTIQKLSQEIHCLVEFEPISDINVATNFGQYLFDNIQHVSQDNLENISKDIQAFMNVLACMFKDIPSFEVGTNRQRDLTRVFVNEFKNDTQESAAYLVIDKLTQFLKKYIKPSEINQTQISMDLVDLGVKKTRRTRGNVYGIACPDDSQIHGLTLRNAGKFGTVSSPIRE